MPIATLPTPLYVVYWTASDGQSDMIAGRGPTPELATADAEREVARYATELADAGLGDLDGSLDEPVRVQ